MLRDSLVSGPPRGPYPGPPRRHHRVAAVWPARPPRRPSRRLPGVWAVFSRRDSRDLQPGDGRSAGRRVPRPLPLEPAPARHPGPGRHPSRVSQSESVSQSPSQRLASLRRIRPVRRAGHSVTSESVVTYRHIRVSRDIPSHPSQWWNPGASLIRVSRGIQSHDPTHI